MIEMLVIAFFVVVIDKTGFLLTEDIENIIYVKEAGEETTVKQKKAKTEKPVEEKPKQKRQQKQSKPVPTSSVLEEPTESVLKQNITAVTQNNSNSLQSEVLTEPSLDLEYDSLESFAKDILKEVKGG